MMAIPVSTLSSVRGRRLRLRNHRWRRGSESEQIARIALGYTDHPDNLRLLDDVGFRVAGSYGSWTGGPVSERLGELICVCERPA